MDRKLKILHLEDSRSDAELVSRVLKKGKIDFEKLVIESKNEFIKALKEFSPDIILSDHSLPSFNSYDALVLLRETGMKIPFILITANISEEFAVDVIKRGADDYVLKDRLERLPTAINNALEKFRLEKERQSILDELIKNEKRYRALIEKINEAIILINANGEVIYQSPSAENVTGFVFDDVLNKAAWKFIHPDDTEASIALFQKAAAQPGISLSNQYRILHKAGHFIWAEGTITNLLHDENVKAFIVNYRDITERKKAEEKIINANRLIAFISHINQAIVRVKNEQTLFEEACRIAVEEGKFKMAWIGIADSALRKVKLTASCGVQESDIKILTDYTYEIEGPFEKTLQGLDYYVVNDIDKEFGAGWNQYAQERSFNSFISLSVKKSGKVFAAFVIYSSEINFFNAEEITMLKEVTADISFALDVFEEQRQKLQADEKLAESELRLKQAQAVSHLGNWELNYETGIAIWSDEQLRIYGLPPDDHKQTFKSWISYIYPEDLHDVLRVTNETKSTLINSAFFHRILRKDGSIRHLYCQTRVKYNTQGKPTGLHGVAQDVTEMKEAEKALRESESNLQAIFENTSEGFILTDLNGNIRSFNNKAKEIFQLNSGREIRIGKSIFDFVDESRKEMYKNAIPKVLSGENLQYDLSFKRKNGETKWLSFAINRVHHSGRVEGFSITTSDITQRKVAEDTLRQSEFRYRRIVETAQEGIWMIDENNLTTFVNKKMCEMMGYTEEEMIGKQNYSFKDEEGKKIALEQIVKRKQGMHEIHDSKFITKSGKHIWTNLSTNPVYNDNGEYKGALAMISDITEKKNLEVLLNKTNQLARIGSWEVSLLNNTIYWSSVTKEIHEVDKDFTPDLETGINFYKAGSGRGYITHAIEEAIEKDIPYDLELQIVTAKGNERWVRVIGKPEFMDGKCTRLYGSFQDIDARKTAELEVLNAYEEKNVILESIADGFFTVDNNWIITYWNKQAEKMLDRLKIESIGKSLWEVYSHNIDSPFYTYFHKAVKENAVQHFEAYSEKQDRWYGLSAYPTGNGLSVYFKDETERKFAEQRIKLERNLLRTLIDNLPDAIYFKDKSARKLISNKIDYTLCDAKTEEEVLGKTDIEILPNELASIGYHHDLEILSTGKPLINFEQYFKTEQGEPLWLVTTKLAIRNEKNEIIGLLGIGRDITEKKIAEEKLNALNEELEKHVKQLVISNTELEQFAYVASHDLQEPLRMVTSFLTRIEKKYNSLLDDKGKQYIHFAVDGAKRMRQIILDLLEFSRIGRTEDQPEDIDLNDLVNEILSLHRKQIQENKAVIKTTKLPVLKTFRTPLRQVFQNLINNGLKYHTKGVAVEIAISLKSTETHWLFAIADNGIGIDPQYFDKIFIIFQRLHSKEEYAGTGMGLAITKKIIENMGGKIWVESQSSGTTFYFTLPK